MTIKIITTSDGSHSLLNTDLNETYHSNHGALQESIHVFINHGLKFLIETYSPNSVNIFEVGFGTGLNALLTLQQSINSDIIFNYTSIEAFPLEKDIWSELNYGSAVGMQEQFKQLHEAVWNTWVEINPNFRLRKLNDTLQEISLENEAFNLIYFDAFAPSKQPEMWEMRILQKMVQIMTTKSVFVTYCAKGQLKRDLKSLGLDIETLTGPPGKKEMVRGLKK